MGKYMKLTGPIEAVQFDDTVESVEAIRRMGIEPAVAAGMYGPELVIESAGGEVENVPVGWWIVKWEDSTFYTCSPLMFGAYYRRVEEKTVAPKEKVPSATV